MNGPCVYFIQSGHDLGPIKIGWTMGLRGRLRLLQTGSAARLFVLGYVEFPSRRLAEVHERAQHARFAADRLRGEWFRASERIFHHIENLRNNILTFPADEYVKALTDPWHVMRGHRFGGEEAS
jgi:T5orf172 domain